MFAWGLLTAFKGDDLNPLTAYAVQVGYPGEDPDEADARRAVEITHAVRRLIRRWLGL